MQKNMEKLMKKIECLEGEVNTLKSKVNEQKELGKMSKSFNMTPYTNKGNEEEESVSENSFDRKELILEHEDESDNNSMIKADIISFGSTVTKKSIKPETKEK